jgi:prepilin-type N-terminal cleavage/methylation domain-containing protein
MRGSAGARFFRRAAGYTMIEMLVTVSIIAILASIALPKFADLMQKSQEGSTKGSLGSLRGALSIYYSDNQGAYPNCLVLANSPVLMGTLLPNYITQIDIVKTTLHPPTNAVYCDSILTAGNVHDGQGWYYDGDINDPLIGSIYVACAHTDTKGSYWTSY